MSTLSLRLRKAAIISLTVLGSLVALTVIIFVVYLFAIMHSNSTRNGPLAKSTDNSVLAEANQLLAGVPKLRDLSNDSLRFAAMPSFGKKWFAVALSNNGKKVEGSAVIWDRETKTKATVQFLIPLSEYLRMTGVFDKQVNGYWGEARGWTDGTSLAFERRSRDRTVSGVGNSPCHYAVVTNALARNLSGYVPNIAELIDTGAESYSQSEHCSAF
jgi:hypothetical protein